MQMSTYLIGQVHLIRYLPDLDHRVLSNPMPSNPDDWGWVGLWGGTLPQVPLPV